MTAPRSRPPRLRPGDTVAVVATSGPLDPDRLRRGVALLESWGLHVRVGEHALDTDPTYPFLAGTDADRAQDLQSAWCHPDVAAVFVGRGGAGAARLVDRLDWTAMAAAGPKVLVGFSDVTALHAAVAAHLGLVTLFGPMPATQALGELPTDEVAADGLRRALLEPPMAVVEGATREVGGTAAGVLTGGTLSLLAGSVGLPEQGRADGAIVLLEDVGEPAFRLDNRLTQLLRAGWFDGVRGVVLGSWTDCGASAPRTIAARLATLGVPMVSGVPFGHCAGASTVPLGVPATLDADDGTVVLDQPALA
jgi:muramoyltetrapeptide carboxypeptidase